MCIRVKKETERTLSQSSLSSGRLAEDGRTG